MSLKMLREDLCRRQVQAQEWPPQIQREVADLIVKIDYYRPLGVDGKHGDRHTAWCGCEDK